MTAPVTTDALVRSLQDWLQSRFLLSTFQAEARTKALVAGPLAPLLAANQQVTAERDEARERITKLEADVRAAVLEIGEQARARGEAEGALRVSEMAGIVDGWRERASASEAALATANADLARLRAEGEAKDWALKEAEACLSIVEPRSDTAEYLRTLGVVRTALARAATAREGA